MGRARTPQYLFDEGCDRKPCRVAGIDDVAGVEPVLPMHSDVMAEFQDRSDPLWDPRRDRGERRARLRTFPHDVVLSVGYGRPGQVDLLDVR